MTQDEAIKTIHEVLDCTCGDEADSSYFSKDLDLAIETLVQENFWELAGKPAVETSGDVEGVVRDISTLCHTNAAVCFDLDMCSRIIITRDERIRRECADKLCDNCPVLSDYESALCSRKPAQCSYRAAIIGEKE